MNEDKEGLYEFDSMPNEAGDEMSRYARFIWFTERFDDVPRTMTVGAAAIFLGISKSAAYERIKDGTLRAVRLGGRLVVTRHELFRMVYLPEWPSDVA